jgi:hypothetical protein
LFVFCLFVFVLIPLLMSSVFCSHFQSRSTRPFG